MEELKDFVLTNKNMEKTSFQRKMILMNLRPNNKEQFKAEYIAIGFSQKI